MSGGPGASVPGSHVPDTVRGGLAAICCVLPSSPARRNNRVCRRFLGQSLSGLFIKQVERELSKGFRVAPDSQDTVLWMTGIVATCWLGNYDRRKVFNFLSCVFSPCGLLGQ